MKKELDARVKVFQERRDEICDRLNKIDGMRCFKPGAAFYLFPNIDGIVKKFGIDVTYEKLAKENPEIRS